MIHPLHLSCPTKATPLDHRYRLAHLFDAETFAAVQAALATGRPLLLTGEPGVGKTQVALAAAAVLQRILIPFTITGETTAKDLLYEFDAVGRLADAQVPAAERVVKDLAPKNYLRPGPVWYAFAWEKAKERSKPGCGYQPPDPPTERSGTVLLLDEIDKADPDLPNGLLECLGDGRFTVPFQTEPVSMAEPSPLVIITSNGERALPGPFLRRCILHRMSLGADETAIRQRLIACGRAQFQQKDLSDEVYEQAANLILEDRRGSNPDDPHAGLAEYLDLLRAVADLPAGERATCLAKVARFVAKRHADHP